MEISTIVPAEATEARNKIYGVLANAAVSECALEQSWMQLGALLADFKANERWRPLGYQNFPAFMDELRTTYRRGRSQLWAYLNAAEALTPYYDAKQLEALGITKAQELRRAIALTKQPLPETITVAGLPVNFMGYAQATSVKELRAAIAEALCLPDDRQPGSWFDFGGCYFTAEEKKSFVEAVRVAKAQLNIKPHVPEHIQRKEIMLAFASEYFQTWAHEVDGPGTPQEPV